jgi:pyruvate kinase
MPLPRTKIVCTLGPACEGEAILREMIRAGMNVARVNFSHGDHDSHARAIAQVRRLAQEENRVVAILGDLQGPRLRIGEFHDGSVMLADGATFSLTTRPVPGDAREVSVSYAGLPQDAKPGSTILLDDGLIELRVLETTAADVRCQVVAGGILGSRKGITLPGTSLSLPPITDKDKADLASAIKQEVDYIALSFVSRAADIEQFRGLIVQVGASIPIIAKIEKAEAIANFDGILAASDGVMVARGDLGVEMPTEEVPILQKRIIRAANLVGVPVITATQMLNSMIEEPRPTRAETSDVVNAILDGTDSVMLSGETSVGKYPVEAVRMMARIAEAAEGILPYRESGAPTTVTDAIGQATDNIAQQLGAKAIITSTSSGYTARMVARHRPTVPIVAVTVNPTTQRQLALVWGVDPVLVPPCGNTDEMIHCAMSAVVQKKLAAKGDIVVITAGVPLGVAGRTNMVQVQVV